MDEDKPVTLPPDVLEMIAQSRETIKRSRQLLKDSDTNLERSSESQSDKHPETAVDNSLEDRRFKRDKMIYRS